MFYIKKLLNYFLNLLFPISCLSCNKEGRWLCSSCINTILSQSHSQTTCPICNISGYKDGAVCLKCQNEYQLNIIFIASSYENELIQKLIKTFKYNFIKDLSWPIAEIMINYFSQLNLANLKTKKLIQLTVLPSPLSKKRLRWRGFNQSDLLAKIIAKKLNLRYFSDIIVKTKNAAEQAELNRKQRLTNIKGAFCFNKKYLAQKVSALGGNFLSDYYLIIDDVITTGATLGEMAKVLKANGAKEIWALVVAKN